MDPRTAAFGRNSRSSDLAAVEAAANVSPAFPDRVSSRRVN
jgi:hypothetical protein